MNSKLPLVLLGLTLAIMTVLAATALDAWLPLGHSTTASWAQAIGGIAAVIAAIIVGNAQINADRAREEAGWQFVRRALENAADDVVAKLKMASDAASSEAYIGPEVSEFVELEEVLETFNLGEIATHSAAVAVVRLKHCCRGVLAPKADGTFKLRTDRQRLANLVAQAERAASVIHALR